MYLDRQRNYIPAAMDSKFFCRCFPIGSLQIPLSTPFLSVVSSFSFSSFQFAVMQLHMPPSNNSFIPSSLLHHCRRCRLGSLARNFKGKRKLLTNVRAESRQGKTVTAATIAGIIPFFDVFVHIEAQK